MTHNDEFVMDAPAAVDVRADAAPLPQRDMVEQEYGKMGDSTQGGIVWEGTLRVTAPKAQSCVWDLNQ